jgi:hypothetical protein
MGRPNFPGLDLSIFRSDLLLEVRMPCDTHRRWMYELLLV